MTVRELKPDQVEAVDRRLPLDRLDQQAREGSTYLIAWEDDRPVGHAHIAWSGTHLGLPEIQDVFVLPELRRRGIASQLTHAAEDEARRRGWDRISLSVSEEGNAAARLLYSNLGYVDAGADPVRVSGQIMLRGRPFEVDDTLVYLTKDLRPRRLGFGAMAAREAACRCGQLRLEVEGDPFSVSICNCLACQRRTGSAFGMQAGFNADQVQITGRFSDYARISDEADRKEHVFHFCPECGSQVFYTEPEEPDLIVVSVGAFADPSFPPPTRSGYDSRRHPWIGLPDSVSTYSSELWEPARALYEAGEYAEAANRGRELLEAHGDDPVLLYNVACCESLAGRTSDALEHLERAIAIWDCVRNMATDDSDFDSVREEPAFQELIGR